jgi:hypothetical protein
LITEIIFDEKSFGIDAASPVNRMPKFRHFTSQKNGIFPFSLLWRFDLIPGDGNYLWGFAITLVDTPHSVGLLWTSDQPATETST